VLTTDDKRVQRGLRAAAASAEVALHALNLSGTGAERTPLLTAVVTGANFLRSQFEALSRVGIGPSYSEVKKANTAAAAEAYRTVWGFDDDAIAALRGYMPLKELIAKHVKEAPVFKGENVIVVWVYDNINWVIHEYIKRKGAVKARGEISVNGVVMLYVVIQDPDIFREAKDFIAARKRGVEAALKAKKEKAAEEAKEPKRGRKRRARASAATSAAVAPAPAPAPVVAEGGEDSASAQIDPRDLAAANALYHEILRDALDGSEGREMDVDEEDESAEGEAEEKTKAELLRVDSGLLDKKPWDPAPRLNVNVSLDDGNRLVARFMQTVGPNAVHLVLGDFGTMRSFWTGQQNADPDFMEFIALHGLLHLKMALNIALLSRVIPFCCTDALLDLFNCSRPELDGTSSKSLVHKQDQTVAALEGAGLAVLVERFRASSPDALSDALSVDSFITWIGVHEEGKANENFAKVLFGQMLPWKIAFDIAVHHGMAEAVRGLEYYLERVFLAGGNTNYQWVAVRTGSACQSCSLSLSLSRTQHCVSLVIGFSAL